LAGEPKRSFRPKNSRIREVVGCARKGGRTMFGPSSEGYDVKAENNSIKISSRGLEEVTNYPRGANPTRPTGIWRATVRRQ